MDSGAIIIIIIIIIIIFWTFPIVSTKSPSAHSQLFRSSNLEISQILPHPS